MKNILRLAVALVVCFLTWLTTNAILAQQREKVASPKPKDKMITRMKPRQINDTNVKQAQINPIGEQFVALTHLDKYTATVVDGRAFVSAKATITDRRAGISYIWRLRILDSAGKPATDVWYDQQIFGMEADGAMEPTFNDIIELPPGKCMVQLSLYEFPNGIDQVLLKDEATSAGFLALRGVKKVAN